MQAGLVSAVIPAYNARDTISAAIDSIQRQTYSSIEVIVVDDGSADGTGQWVKQHYPAVQVEVVPNQGPSRARNHGISCAHGEFIAFLDADDTWHPQKIEAQVKVLQRYPEAELVASDWVRDETFSAIPDETPISWITYANMLQLNRFQTSTVLMRASVLGTLGGFDPAVDGAEDWDLWLRTSAVGRIAKLDWPLVMYRDMPAGYSKDVWRVYQTMQPMLEKHRNSAPVSAWSFAELESWHHMRFSVAFFLMHETGHAGASLKAIGQRRLWGPAMVASIRYLTPFLWKRWRRRS